MKNQVFEPDQIYHIFNHANGNENLFLCDENYNYFLKKYAEYIYPIAETYAWCLMPNHLHLMVEIRSFSDLHNFKNVKDSEEISILLSRQFSHFFNCYTKSFNKRYDRRGSLFQPNFKRKCIHDDSYFSALIAYIHNNPVHHGFCSSPDEWPYSSWHTYLSTKPTRLMRESGLNWFGDQESFIAFHRQIIAKDVMFEFE